MYLFDQEAIREFLTKFDLQLVQSEEPDPIRGPWVIVDAAGEIWSGPFLSVPALTSWLLEHCAYALNETEKLKRFIQAYENGNSEAKASLEAALYPYRIGRTPEAFYALFDGICLSPTTLPPDWQERVIGIMRAHPDRVGFERRATDYLSQNSLK